MGLIELDLTGDAYDVGLLESLDDRIRVQRIGPSHGVCVNVDGVVGADSGIDGCTPKTFHELIPEWNRLRSHGSTHDRETHRFRNCLAADASKEVGILAFHVDTADRDRYLCVVPLLNKDIRGGGREEDDQVLCAAFFNLCE
jgi:hypothetical protein